jgi:hypothetical protein
MFVHLVQNTSGEVIFEKMGNENENQPQDDKDEEIIKKV